MFLENDLKIILFTQIFPTGLLKYNIVTKLVKRDSDILYMKNIGDTKLARTAYYFTYQTEKCGIPKEFKCSLKCSLKFSFEIHFRQARLDAPYNAYR